MPLSATAAPPWPLTALAAGLLLTAGLPPFGFWPLALLGVAVLALVLGERPARGRLAVGLLAGLGFLAPGLWWMQEFSLPGWFLAVVVQTVLFALAPLVSPRRLRWMTLPAAMVLVEGLRGIWPFGGVPIATLAQTQIGGVLAPTVRVGGPLLLAAVVAVTGLALAGLLRAAAARRAAAETPTASLAWTGPLAGVALVAVVAVGGTLATGGPTEGTLRVGVVQGGGERGTRAVETSWVEVYQEHLAVSRELSPTVDLVVWPEDVPKVEGDITADPLARQLSALATDLDATVVVGSAERIGNNFRVMTTVWHPDGSSGDRYHKNHRVPFGEYVPFRPVIERLADISPIPRDAVAGHSPPVLDTPAGTLGIAVSYEVFFPSRTREAVRQGGQVILVPTNATSFSTTQMPALELGAARLRALETGRTVVQSAPTGFSGIVDADGRVVAASDLGARQLLEVDVALRAGRTPYSRTGDLPWVGLAVVALAAGLAVATSAVGPLRPRGSASPARR